MNPKQRIDAVVSFLAIMSMVLIVLTGVLLSALVHPLCLFLILGIFIPFFLGARYHEE